MESLKEPWGRFGNYEDENDSPEREKNFSKSD